MDPKTMKKIVGTPDYLAPEIITKGNYDKTVDWWAVGVIAYELMTGIRPFGAEDIYTVFENIVNMKITFPQVGGEEGQISAEALDLLKSLLNPNSNNRLGMGGAEEVKRHPFFKGINWNSLKEDEAPFIPETENILDIQYFNPKKTNFTTSEYTKDAPMQRAALLGQMKASTNIKPRKEEEDSRVLDDFDATMFNTLAGLNKQAASEAKKQQEKLNSCQKRKSFFNDKAYSLDKLDRLVLSKSSNVVMRGEEEKGKQKNIAKPSRFKK